MATVTGTATHTVPTKHNITVQNFLMTLFEMLGLSSGVKMNTTHGGFKMLIQSPPDANKVFVQIYDTDTGGVPAVETQISPGAMASAPVQGVLVAGVVTLNLANKAGDKLSVLQLAAGGTPGVYYAVQSLSATQVKVFALTVGNTLQSLDTSTVAVWNCGNGLY